VNGYYFITICTYRKQKILCDIVGEGLCALPYIKLTAIGETIQNSINYINGKYDNVSVDKFTIMPNHVHLLLLIITEERMRRAIQRAPMQGRSIISKAVGYIKMNASKVIRQQYGDVTVWQRGYHDHVIRNQADYEMIAKYIHENPLRWELDKFYTE
jgi:REP element-mobilizing transposase RayT